MKAIIPVAGAGTNLRPHTYTQPKPLIPVAGKPILSFIIDKLIQNGVTDFIFVIGYLGEKIRLFVEQKYPGIRKEFIYQEPRLGSAHAIRLAVEYLKKSEEIVIQFGDTIVDLDMKKFLSSESSSIAVKRIEHPQSFGVAEMNKERLILKIIEKPKIPKSNWALVGLYKINDLDVFIKALEFIISHDIKTYAEFQLTDALMHMIEQEHKFYGFEVDNWWDCGQKDQLLQTNALLLDKEPIKENRGVKLERTILIPPVSIGSHCHITDSIIGPHVTIGESSRIQKSVIWNSIIGNFSNLDEAVLKKSVIGNDVIIKGFSQSLNIGDNADIDLSH
jgi:glucose-1-phosphate thymidylyltransferase